MRKWLSVGEGTLYGCECGEGVEAGTVVEVFRRVMVVIATECLLADCVKWTKSVKWGLLG